MVVALIALFVSLTGVGYALIRLPKNSVRSKQIKDGQVKSVDVADNGLTGIDIDESTLSIHGATGPAGPRGATGPQGATGPHGTTGPQGTTGPGGATGLQGPSGTTGQSATTVFSTAGLPPTSTLTLVPGLTQTVTVPANAATYIATTGSIAVSSGTLVADLEIFVDGAPVATQRVSKTASGGDLYAGWSISLARQLSAGPHTIDVRAAQSGAASGSVGGAAGSGTQGALTVMFLKQ
jgi:hypothetical protein